MIKKEVGSISVDDLKQFPVWEFVHGGETLVEPVQHLPVDDLTFRIVGTQVKLHNCTHLWADISNIDLNNAFSSEQFLTLAVHRSGKRFVLCRYFDIGYIRKGPHALASFLNLPVKDVFPISYDISKYVLGNPSILRGDITEEPRERLTEDEIIALAIKGKKA